MARRRTILSGGGVGLLLALAVLFRTGPQEPKYQGKRLTAWLDELVGTYTAAPAQQTPEWFQQRRSAAEQALRSMGTNSLPALLRLLTLEPKHSLVKAKLLQLLNRQTIVKIHLALERDRRDQAVEAFKILGPQAKSAVAQLAQLIEGNSAEYAIDCLQAIGPDSVPVLLKAMSNPKDNLRFRAIEALGHFGKESQEAVPLLEAFAAGTNPRLASIAIPVLSEIETNHVKSVPLFVEKLSDTNVSLYASFALGRTEPEGMLKLLDVLTNSCRQIKLGALAALAPEIRKTRRESDPTNYSFRAVQCMFNSRMLELSWRLYAGSDEKTLRAGTLNELMAEKEQRDLRLRLVESLAACGAAGACGLSRASESKDVAVRQKARDSLDRLGVQVRDGGIIRGPLAKKRVALLFTGHEFAESATVILDELRRHQGKASFFLTGAFLTNAAYHGLIRRMIDEGHYVGPHSDQHLLYCSWEQPKRTLLTKSQFAVDLLENRRTLQTFGISANAITCFLPPYEHYNQEIADWTCQFGMVLVNFTIGTRSNADYTGEADANFVSTQQICDSIIAWEQQDPNGLNGFLLRLHLGSGPARADKFDTRFAELLDYLAERKYELVSVESLLTKGGQP